jgi:DnaK suppressor protein
VGSAKIVGIPRAKPDLGKNSMNTAELEKRLREKERELLADMERTEAEARDSRIAEAEDRADDVVSSENKESLFQKTTSDWNVFNQVRDALQRIENGTYGKCADCGRQIEENRLDSLPWTPYCLDDQDQHDREAVSAL